MKNNTNILDDFPFEEHEIPGIPFKFEVIRMDDFKLHAEDVFRFMRNIDAILVIRETDDTSTLLCRASVYEWLKEHEILDEIQKPSDTAERST